MAAQNGNEIAGVSDVAEAVLPSIVAIDVKVISEQRDFFGRTYQSEGSGKAAEAAWANVNAAILYVADAYDRMTAMGQPCCQ